MNLDKHQSAKEAEKETLVTCRNHIQARIIAARLYSKYPKYDFWCVESTGVDGVQVQVGSGLDKTTFSLLLGFALGVQNVTNDVFGSELSWRTS